MTRKNFSVLFVIVVFFSFSLFCESSFTNIDINSEDDILFTVAHKAVGAPNYSTLFKSNVNEVSKDVSVLTCFPERIEAFDNGNMFEIRNHYGTALYSFLDNSFEWISVSYENLNDYFRPAYICVSPNGLWGCYIKKTGNATGNLILRNMKSRVEVILATDIAFSYDSVPAKWSPDSDVLLYAHDDYVYFIEPSNAFGKIKLSEDIRCIGSGNINSVSWSTSRHFFYITGDLIYKMSENGLYTRGLYSSLIGTGKAVGRLAFNFNCVEDKFWMNGAGSEFILIQKNQLLSYFSIDEDSFSYVTPKMMMPFTDKHGSAYQFDVLWTSSSISSSETEKPTLWVNMISAKEGKQIFYVYLMDKTFVSMFNGDGYIRPSLSPDRYNVAFCSGNGMYVYNLRTGKEVSHLSGEKITSFSWKDKNSIIVGGCNTIRLWNYAENVAKLLYLSSADDCYWNGQNITAYSNGKKYAYSAKGKWIEQISDMNKEKLLTHMTQNERYRLFLSDNNALNDGILNCIYVRGLFSSDTKMLFPFEKKDKNFSKKKRVAIVFDALDNAVGLSHILNTLNVFSIKSTFFINGEFIRRYPDELEKILAEGHDCASMFYTAVDLTKQNGFVIDKDFIKRGLARNEDEFFAQTKKELSLYWHAPYYAITTDMVDAAKSSGYRYVDIDNHSCDTTTYEESHLKNKKYYSVSDLIDKYVSSVHDGSIIAVSTGLSKGSRSDYLYENLDLLITALVDNNCEIVPLKSLNSSGL